MACEDFPCCGHEAGCCPDFDESGRQLNMICTCGARLPVDNRISICDACMDAEDDGYDDDCEYVEADAEIWPSCRWGTDDDDDYGDCEDW